MKPAADQRRAELARIHILKGELKLDREQYEAVLWTIGQVDSSAKLDAHGRRAVIAHLQGRLRDGAASAWVREKPPGPAPAPTVPGTVSPGHVDQARGVKQDPEKPHNLPARPQLRKIAAQLHAAKKPWAYAREICHKLYGKRTIEFADSRELAGVITALAKDATRHGRAR